MRSRFATLLLVAAVFGLCLSVSADDDRKEKERGDRKKRSEDKKTEGMPEDAKPANPVPVAAKAADPKADKAVSYKTDVAPLLKDACASCHSGAKQKARLDVTSYDSLMKFVKAGEPDKSKLHNSLLGKGAKLMPPKNPLSDDQIAIVKAWIAAGAKKD